MNRNNNRGILSFLGNAVLSSIFLVAFLCISSTSGHAQGIMQPANYNWKTTDDARNILVAQVTVLNNQMPGISEGTPLYDNTLRRVAYFKSIINELGKGASLAEALELSLPAAATLGFEKEASYTPKVLLKALQTETRILLTN